MGKFDFESKKGALLVYCQLSCFVIFAVASISFEETARCNSAGRHTHTHKEREDSENSVYMHVCVCVCAGGDRGVSLSRRIRAV